MLLERPVRITPRDIYAWEDEYYPESRWTYLGRKGQFHYFDRYGQTDEVHAITLFAPLKLHRRHFGDFEGYTYDKEDPKRESADVEIWAEHIRVEIDGQEPLLIPFESKGFTTEARRSDRPSRYEVIAVTRGDGEPVDSGGNSKNMRKSRLKALGR